MVDVVYTYENPVSERDIDKIVACLNNDGVIAYPTDVNWAFGVKATSKKGLDSVLSLKPSHPIEKPLSLIFHSISQVSEYAEVDNFAYRVLKKILPGPYTVILPRTKSLPKQLDDKRKVLGVRIPKREILKHVVEKLGVPLATTSVYLEKKYEGPVFGYQIDEIFGHALDMVVDLGSEMEARETTILDMSEGGINVIRQGVGPIEGL